MDKLNAAMEAIEKAVDLTPRTHPNRAMYLANLSVTIRCRFQRTGSMQGARNTAVETSGGGSQFDFMRGFSQSRRSSKHS